MHQAKPNVQIDADNLFCNMNGDVGAVIFFVCPSQVPEYYLVSSSASHCRTAHSAQSTPGVSLVLQLLHAAHSPVPPLICNCSGVCCRLLPTGNCSCPAVQDAGCSVQHQPRSCSRLHTRLRTAAWEDCVGNTRTRLGSAAQLSALYLGLI